MLACIPTNSDAGLEAQVSEHFGSAPFFTLYNSETGEVTPLPNGNAQHSHGACSPLQQLAQYNINCVVCQGMGRRAIEALNAAGIAVYHAGSDKVEQVVEGLKNNSLTEMDPTQACRGHGHGGQRGRGGCQGHSQRQSGFGQQLGR